MSRIEILHVYADQLGSLQWKTFGETREEALEAWDESFGPDMPRPDYRIVIRPREQE